MVLAATTAMNAVGGALEQERSDSRLDENAGVAGGAPTTLGGLRPAHRVLAPGLSCCAPLALRRLTTFGGRVEVFCATRSRERISCGVWRQGTQLGSEWIRGSRSSRCCRWRGGVFR